MSLDLYNYLHDSLKEIESVLKQCGCKQITLNKNGSYRPVKIGIRSYTSLCYGTLTGFNGDSDKNIRILLGTAPFRGGEKLFIAIKKAELGNLSIRGYTTISNYYTDEDYLIENVTVESSISFIKDEIKKTIQSIKDRINKEFVLADQAVQKFLSDTNTRFTTVSSLVKDGLIGLGCKDISVDNSKQKELTRENGKTEVSFSFEAPKSELFMSLTLSISLQDYDYKEKRSSIQAVIYFSPIWIMDSNQIKDIDSLKDKLESYSCSAYIVRDSDVERGVSEIVDRVSVLDTYAKKNIDLYNEMISGNLSIKNADILNMTSILSHLPDLFVKALQKSSVSDLDKGERAYYNNLVKVKKEYDSGNYETLEDLYSMFKFCCDEIHRKVKNLSGKKGIADQYKALFDLYFHKLNGTWESIAKKFNNTTIGSLF